jgi:hypothetical protein
LVSPNAESRDREQDHLPPPAPPLRPAKISTYLARYHDVVVSPSGVWRILYRGIGYVYIEPKTPRLNGKAERSHRIDAEEFYRPSTASCSTTASCSPTNSRNARTTTTSIGPAAWMDRPPTNGYDSRQPPRRVTTDRQLHTPRAGTKTVARVSDCAASIVWRNRHAHDPAPTEIVKGKDVAERALTCMRDRNAGRTALVVGGGRLFCGRSPRACPA